MIELCVIMPRMCVCQNAQNGRVHVRVHAEMYVHTHGYREVVSGTALGLSLSPSKWPWTESYSLEDHPSL